ncbi:TolC family protein [Marinilabilia salmonicolor]|uniref:Outer membrane protein TolC n=1 Tax=Marinilabilia salmonicolor TaxID=989 RepID=A0A368ULG1_9BACT|nr:TolC family protein [Marinilabilia salmonicolor]RCW29549.1 outer membrane protein TolC [Marinilabilia salmonicolor]
MKPGNIKLRGLLYAFCLWASTTTIEAQTGDTLSFTLEQAIEYASVHAYEKINSEYDVASAKKKIWETIASGLPQVDFSAQYNHSIDVPVSLLPAEIIPEDMRPPGIGSGDKIPVSFGTAYDGSYSLSVSQMIFNGSYFVGLQATQVFLDLTRHQATKTEIEVRDAVAKACYLVLSAEENIKAFNENLEVNKALLQETEALYESGFRESMDVSQLKLMVRESEKQILEIKRNQEVAMAVLRFSMGLNENQPIKLTEDFAALSQEAISGEVKKSGWSPEEHIDFKLASTNVKSEKLQLKNLRVQYLPKINAFYTYQKTGYGDEWNIFGDEWYKAQFVGLSVSVPIFSSGMRNAQAMQQKLAWEKSKNIRTQTMQQIKTSGLTALTDYNSAIDQYEIASESKVLALDIYEKTKTRFSNGMTGSFELTQQQGQYIQAQINHVRAALAVLNSRNAYLKATGKL